MTLSPGELARAFHLLTSGLDPVTRIRLAAAGVPAEALDRVRAAQVAWQAGRRFEFDEADGDAAIAVLALDAEGAPVDVVAGRGSRLASWWGRVPVLGLERLYAARIGDQAIDVCTSFVEHLRGRGILIIDPGPAAVHLKLASPIRVQSERLRTDLLLAISEAVLPRVLVAEDGRR